MIAWADVRWRFRRGRASVAGSAGTIALDLLRPADDARLDEVVAYHEALVGESRAEADPSALEELVGDYRLARGLAATLSEWYRYRTPTLAEAAPEAERTLRAHGVARPADIRRRLWERANREGGFAAGAARQRIIAAVAAELGLDPERCWHLARLDGDRAARLERAGDAPSAPGLRRAYNQAAVEAVLFRAETVSLNLPGLDGPTARHLIARCRRLGLICELANEPGRPGALRLELFGRPEQVGPAGGYGRQLATTVLWLLGSVAAEGHVLLPIGARHYALPLDRTLLGAIGAGERVREAPAGYDSAAEATLHREWRVAADRGLAGGWTLAREPELLVVGGHVMLPDFRLDRAERRVHLELVGFWSESYVERKRRKLEAAAAAGVPLLVAVEANLRDRLGALPLPTVWYRGEVHWSEVAAAVEQHFGDRAGRTEAAAAGLAPLWREVAGRDLVAETELRQRLDLHSHAELEAVLTGTRALPEGWLWLAGVGLVRRDLLRRLGDSLRQLLSAAGGAIALSEAVAWLAENAQVPSDLADPLLGRLDGVAVDWSDMFQPIVRSSDTNPEAEAARDAKASALGHDDA